MDLECGRGPPKIHTPAQSSKNVSGCRRARFAQGFYVSIKSKGILCAICKLHDFRHQKHPELKAQIVERSAFSFNSHVQPWPEPWNLHASGGVHIMNSRWKMRPLCHFLTTEARASCKIQGIPCLMKYCRLLGGAGGDIVICTAGCK